VQEDLSIMKKKLVRGLMVLAVGCLSAGAGQARDLLQNVQLDVFGMAGGSTMVDAQNWFSAGNLYHSRFEAGPKFTVGASVPYGSLVSIEGYFTMGPNNLIVTNTDQNPRQNIEYQMMYYSGGASLLIHAPFSKFHWRPYAAMGMEYDRYSPSNSAVAYAFNHGFAAVAMANINHNDKFGFNAGAGLERKITRRWTFRLDVRDHVTGSPAFGLPHVPTVDSAATYPVSGRVNNLEYTAGFLFHLGKL
jgi:opacity protein-like surface antigen